MSFITRNLAYAISMDVRDLWKVRKAMKEYAKEHPQCEYCGRDRKVDVHHIVPVSVAPELAAERYNMMTLCRKPPCHQVIGHMGDFREYNASPEATASGAFRKKEGDEEEHGNSSSTARVEA